MILGRLIDWLLVGVSAALLGYDLLQFLHSQRRRALRLGEFWFKLDVGSLNLAQAVIQRYIFPELWDPVLVSFLLWPAALTFFAAGILFLLLFRKKKPKETSAFTR